MPPENVNRMWSDRWHMCMRASHDFCLFDRAAPGYCRDHINQTMRIPAFYGGVNLDGLSASDVRKVILHVTKKFAYFPTPEQIQAAIGPARREAKRGGFSKPGSAGSKRGRVDVVAKQSRRRA